MSISAVDLFCGAGGLTHGLTLEGLKVNAGVDIDPACQYPYERNNAGCTFLLKDVDDMSTRELKGLYPKGNTRVLVGCAPCQPFSTYSQGHASPTHSKWALLRSFARIIARTQPHIVSMENVPRLLKHSVYGEFRDQLEGDGYHVSATIVRCADYGVPQTRKRLVLLASRLGPIDLIPPTHSADRQVTVQDTIGHLPAIEAGGVCATDRLHRSKNLTGINLRRMRASTPGGTWRDWPKDLVAACHKKKTCRTYTSVYGRMEWDKPAPTITTQCCGFGNGRFGHPEQDRAISLREAALLQTFPGTYDLVPPDADVSFQATARLIGNAVPVTLGRVIAKSILEHWEEHRA